MMLNWRSNSYFGMFQIIAGCTGEIIDLSIGIQRDTFLILDMSDAHKSMHGVLRLW
jgi:hypothetical protein